VNVGARYLVGIGVGAVVTAAMIAALGADVPLAFAALLRSALGSLVGVGQTLNKVTPLLLGGLAVAVGLRAGCFNIGVDGQIYLGAILATGLALRFEAGAMPAAVLLSLTLAAGAAGGAAFGWIPGLLRARWGVSEIFVTVMLNFVALYLTEYLATGPWNDPMAGEAITRPIPTEASLPLLLPMAGMHAGILVALAAAMLVWVVLERTALGFELGAVGDNPRAARIAGIDTRRLTALALTAGGALAGLAGAIEVAGLHNRLILGLSPGYGVMALLVSVLGKNRVPGVVVAAAGMGILAVGSDSLQRSVGLPASAALVFQAAVVLTVVLLESLGARRAKD
jgi:simple sugar transport system permease protein